MSRVLERNYQSLNEFVSRSIARRAAIPSKSRQPDGPECGALGLHAPVCPLRIGTRYSCDREPSFPQARDSAIRLVHNVRVAFGYVPPVRDSSHARFTRESGRPVYHLSIISLLLFSRSGRHHQNCCFSVPFVRVR